MPIELTTDEQVMEIEDAIDSTIEYYIMCDQCNGVTNLESSGVARELFDQGWRMVDSNGRVLLTCPRCAPATTPTSGGEQP